MIRAAVFDLFTFRLSKGNNPHQNFSLHQQDFSSRPGARFREQFRAASGTKVAAHQLQYSRCGELHYMLREKVGSRWEVPYAYALSKKPLRPMNVRCSAKLAMPWAKPCSSLLHVRVVQQICSAKLLNSWFALLCKTLELRQKHAVAYYMSA